MESSTADGIQWVAIVGYRSGGRDVFDVVGVFDSPGDAESWIDNQVADRYPTYLNGWASPLLAPFPDPGQVEAVRDWPANWMGRRGRLTAL